MISSSAHHHGGPSSIFDEVPVGIESKDDQESLSQEEESQDEDDDDSFYLHSDPIPCSHSSSIATTALASSPPTYSSRLLSSHHHNASLSEGDCGGGGNMTRNNRIIPVVTNNMVNTNTAAFLAAAATTPTSTSTQLNPGMEATNMLLHNLLPGSSYSQHPIQYLSQTAKTTVQANLESQSILTNHEPTMADITADHPSSNININRHTNNNITTPQRTRFYSSPPITNPSPTPLQPPPTPENPQPNPKLYYDQSRLNDPIPDSRRNRGGVTEPFPEKLHSMLTYAITAHLTDIISFFPHGRAFGIHKPKRFSDEIMPRFFRQTRLTSFQRQLNLYGFRRPGLCVNMKRTKVKGLGGKIRRNLDTEPNFYAMPAIREATTDSAGSNTISNARTGGGGGGENGNFAGFKLLLQNHHNNSSDIAHLVLGSPTTPAPSSPCINDIHSSQNSTIPFSIPSIKHHQHQHQHQHQRQQPSMQSNSFFSPTSNANALVAPYTAAQVRFAQPLSLDSRSCTTVPLPYYYNHQGMSPHPLAPQRATILPSPVSNGCLPPSSVTHNHLTNLIRPMMMNDSNVANTIPPLRRHPQQQQHQYPLNMVSPDRGNHMPLQYHTATSPPDSLLLTGRQLHTTIGRDGGGYATRTN